MSTLWLWLGVAAATPAVTVESASLHLASGASVRAESASIDESGLSGRDVSLDKGTLTIRADATQWTLNGSRGTFEGNVQAEHGDLSFSCTRAEVEFGEDGKVLRAEATGGVTVQQSGRKAVGEIASFSGGRLVLSGEPTVQQGSSQMVGKEIIFVVGEDTIECIDCTMRVASDAQP